MCKGPEVELALCDGAERTDVSRCGGGALHQARPYGPYYFGLYRNIAGEIEALKQHELMGFESLYENKDSTPIATAPGSTFPLSLPSSATKCLESVLPPTHSFFNPLQPDCHLHTLEIASLSDLLAVTF